MKRAFLLTLLACAPAAQAQWTKPLPEPRETGKPQVLSDVGWDQKLGAQLPVDLVFRDERGRAVHLSEYLGTKPVVLSLVYYECPMLCTVTLNGLTSALSVLRFDVGREFEVVTVSFDPKETPELAAAKKKAYLSRYRRPGAQAGWHFLTGDAETLAKLTQAVGFRYAWDAETKQYAHPSGILVLTPDGKVSRYLFGIEYAPKDLRLALVEASQSRIGGLADQVLLFCYQYDPATGRYGAAVVNLMRAGAVATLLALGTFVFLALRGERRAARLATSAAASPLRGDGQGGKP